MQHLPAQTTQLSPVKASVTLLQQISLSVMDNGNPAFQNHLTQLEPPDRHLKKVKLDSKKFQVQLVTFPELLTARCCSEV